MKKILVYLETDVLDNGSYNCYALRIHLDLLGFNNNVVDIHKSFVIYSLPTAVSLAFFRKKVHDYEEMSNTYFPIVYTKYDEQGKGITRYI